jgi:hypothetical protein
MNSSAHISVAWQWQHRIQANGHGRLVGMIRDVDRSKLDEMLTDLRANTDHRPASSIQSALA